LPNWLIWRSRHCRAQHNRPLDRERRNSETMPMNAAHSLPFQTGVHAALPPVRDVEFLEMPVKQILNRCDSPRMPFRWTINPYRGCEFGCVYCYARYTHEFLELR